MEFTGWSDQNGDGVLDAFSIDGDGDGYTETYAYDTDGNGILDHITADSDLDGYLDAAAWDTDGDGVYDVGYGPSTGGQVVSLVAPTGGVSIVGGVDAGFSPTVEGFAPTGSIVGGVDHGYPSGPGLDANAMIERAHAPGMDPIMPIVVQGILDSNARMIDRILLPDVDPY